MFTRSIRSKTARMTDKWVSHEQKEVVLIKSDKPLRSPLHLRQILSFSGMRTPLAIIPTQDNQTLLAFAASSALSDIEWHYDNFAKAGKNNTCKPPKLLFHRIDDWESTLRSDTSMALFQPAIRREILRLGWPSCTWRPRSYFVERLR